MPINWEEVREELDERLPTEQTPAKCEVREKMFRKMDTNKNGYLSLSEAQAGLPPLLKNEQRKTHEASAYIVPLTDLKPAVKLAFNEAKSVASATGGKKKKEKNETMVDKREFHALLVAFKAYVEIDIIFEQLDASDQRKLNWKDCSKHLSLLKDWNIEEDRLKAKFPDDWTYSMDFEDFAEYCIQRKMGNLELELDEPDAEETLQEAAGDGDLHNMLEAFKLWDKDGSGTISQEELTKVLMQLDDQFTEAQAEQLFTAADVNKDGKIDWTEFSKWVMQ